MIDGHCLIVPITHEVQSTRLDEDVWEEIKVRTMRDKPVSKTVSNWFY